MNMWIQQHFHDFSKISYDLSFFHDFSRSGNDHFKIPWLFQVFHDRTNPVHTQKQHKCVRHGRAICCGGTSFFPCAMTAPRTSLFAVEYLRPSVKLMKHRLFKHFFEWPGSPQVQRVPIQIAPLHIDAWVFARRVAVACPSDETGSYYHLYFQKNKQAQFPSHPLTMYPCQCQHVSWLRCWVGGERKAWGQDQGKEGGGTHRGNELLEGSRLGTVEG